MGMMCNFPKKRKLLLQAFFLLSLCITLKAHLLYLSTVIVKAEKLTGPRQKEIQKKYKTTIIIKLLIVFITLIIFIFAEINTAKHSAYAPS